MSDSSTSESTDRSARLLNFGCGSAFHPEWLNLDTLPVSPEVIAHDLRRRFPFADGTFDAVYGSHVLEHLEAEAATNLLRDCYRILRPGGIVRIVVPDLEAIVKLYLQSFEGALAGNVESEMHYDWVMLELYDQAVRTASGGGMAAYRRAAVDERQSRFIASRIGEELLSQKHPPSRTHSAAHRILHRMKSLSWSARKQMAALFAFAFLGREGSASLSEGLFRRHGEVHQWMYDRFSLVRLLRQQRFTDIQVASAFESRIPRFARFELDVKDGRIRKPDSLFVEATKA